MEKKKSRIKVQVEPVLVGACQPRQATFTPASAHRWASQPEGSISRLPSHIPMPALRLASGCIFLPASSKTPIFFAVFV